MDNKEKIETDIKDDAEKAEKVSKEEDKDYKVDAEKHTDDREKTIKDDAEKSEQLNDAEKKDYNKIDDFSKTDGRYVKREEYESLAKRMDDLESKYGGEKEKDPYDGLVIDLDNTGKDK